MYFDHIILEQTREVIKPVLDDHRWTLACEKELLCTEEKQRIHNADIKEWDFPARTTSVQSGVLSDNAQFHFTCCSLGSWSKVTWTLMTPKENIWSYKSRSFTKVYFTVSWHQVWIFKDLSEKINSRKTVAFFFLRKWPNVLGWVFFL